jgi:DNA-binding NarL/FixJ family response regulator
VTHSKSPARMSHHTVDAGAVSEDGRAQFPAHVAVTEPEREGLAGSGAHAPEPDSVAGIIRELAAALRAIPVEASIGLPAAIRDGRERLRAIEVGEVAKGEAASVALLDACGLLLDGLDETAKALEASSSEAARRERLRIVRVLTQLEDAADIGAAHAADAGMSPRFPYPSTPTSRPEWRLIHPLTGQEQTVLDLLATGAGTLQIAEILTISPKTAKKHVCNILEKLGVPDRLSAVLRSQELGLLRPVASH